MTALKNNFVEYKNSLEEINRAALTDPNAFVMNTENAYHKNIQDIALQIANERPRNKLVMLAGPSSSGKTTTAHLLTGALKKLGVGCEIISLDDFYLGEHRAPVLPNGQHNYECVEALDIEKIQQCLYDLIVTDHCATPVFDFEIRIPYPHKRHITLKENEIAVVEGIHALNPVLIEKLPAMQVHKIYISVKQGISNGSKELFNPNEMRLIRRIVRDYNFRGTKPEVTLGMWKNVMDGERKYIKPFRKDADFTINSLHAYEPCVLKEQAADLLRGVPEKSPYRGYASKLLNSISRFETVENRIVPQNSMIREFIGSYSAE